MAHRIDRSSLRACGIDVYAVPVVLIDYSEGETIAALNGSDEVSLFEVRVGSQKAHS